MKALAGVLGAVVLDQVLSGPSLVVWLRRCLTLPHVCAVPSALSGLASGFGMGTGRFPDAFTTAKSLGVVIQLVKSFCGREQTVIVCWCLLCYSPWHPTQWCGLLGE